MTTVTDADRARPPLADDDDSAARPPVLFSGPYRTAHAGPAGPVFLDTSAAGGRRYRCLCRRCEPAVSMAWRRGGEIVVLVTHQADCAKLAELAAEAVIRPDTPPSSPPASCPPQHQVDRTDYRSLMTQRPVPR